MKIKLNEITEMKFKKTINENKIKTKKKTYINKKK
jgi:hypothetical protein